MAKFAKWIVGPIAFGLAFFAVKYAVQSARNEEPGLVGTSRSAFIDGAVKTCLPNQRGAPDNRGVPDVIIVEYCNCFAKGMADLVSDSDLKRTSGLKPDERLRAMQPTIDAAAKPCIEQASKSIPQSK